MTDVVCLGILVADIAARPVDDLPERGRLGLVDDIGIRGGGCALNTATALARLGLDVTVAGKLGRDAFGDFLVQLLERRGLDPAGVVRDPATATSATIVLVDSGGERTFLHLIGANATLDARDLDEAIVFSARALHVGGALVMPALDGQPTADLLERARVAGITTSLDTVYDPAGGWERVLPCLPHVDLFTPGYAEAAGITGASDPAEIARRLRNLGAATVAVTLGERGCYVAADDFAGFVDPLAVDAVDGTGSGDAFAAAFLYAHLAGWETQRAARFANAAGALATRTVGASDGVGTLEETLALAGVGATA